MQDFYCDVLHFQTHSRKFTQFPPQQEDEKGGEADAGYVLKAVLQAVL